MRLLSLFLIVLLSFSCQTSQRLNYISSIIKDYPDSALSELQALTLPDYATKREKADYALMMSMALDKCYIDLQSDSIIRPAVSFFSSHLPLEKRMLSNYYLGRVLSNAGNWISAAIAFDKAESIAQSINDYLYLGLIRANIAKIHECNYDDDHAILYLKTAIDAFKKNGDDLYTDYYSIVLANSFSNNNQRDSSMSLFSSLLCKEKMDSYSRRFLYSSYADCLLSYDEESAGIALDYFKKGIIESYNARHYVALGYAAFLDKKTNESAYYMHLADSLANANNELPSIIYYKYLFHKKNGDVATADSLLIQALRYEDEVARAKVKQSTSFAQKEYYQQVATQERFRNRILIICFLIGVTLLFIIIVLLSLRYRNKTRDDMVRIINLNTLLSSERHKNNTIVNSVLLSQVNTLGLLGEEYFNSNKVEQREKYFREFYKKMEVFRKYDSDLAFLEKSVNSLKNDCMTLLRKEVPGQSKHFYRMCTLFFAGFPYDLIHLLTSMSVPTIRSSKSQIRRRIESLSCPSEELFLSLLDSAEKKPSGRPRKS